MSKPIIAWSFSALNTFENCNYKFWATKIGKIVSDVNQYNAKGDSEHLSFEHYLKKGIQLPSLLQPYTPMLDKLVALPGQKYYEYKMTLDSQMVPCRWNEFDKAWVRGAADFVNVHNDKAHYFDWKSGKFRPSDEQIELTSLLIFRHFPEVQQVNAGLLFYKSSQMHPHIVRRATDESRLWNGYIGRVKDLERAVSTGNFPRNPNPLCGWCPVMQCPHNETDARLKREAEKLARA